ncbi:hypothetical protein Tdes44962_MAKER09928 [Teratosphaeria destructans]|uniref:Uncharacterized protein n=1 Tax=Teratosphaeria destructans TaxID=418781 RepID=A0A9W7SQP3_9PEZI|nr:hypothetical protein Tdes44962_MAKER09928 [Teratosphaeria destructans]
MVVVFQVERDEGALADHGPAGGVGDGVVLQLVFLVGEGLVELQGDGEGDYLIKGRGEGVWYMVTFAVAFAVAVEGAGDGVRDEERGGEERGVEAHRLGFLLT